MKPKLLSVFLVLFLTLILLYSINLPDIKTKDDLSLAKIIQINIKKIQFSLSREEKEKALTNLNTRKIIEKEDKLKFYLLVFDPKILMSDLLKDSGQGNSLDCHRPAHILGRISYELYGPHVFRLGNSMCNSGFYHGAMESFLNQKGVENIVSDMNTICKTFNTHFSQFECYHGVGHGILAFEDYDLPAALTICEKFVQSFPKTSCFGGVFMENVVTSEGKGADPSHTTKWANSDPHFPCNYFSNDKDLEKNCYQMQTSRMLILFKNDFGKVLQECLKTKKEIKPICFRSFGRDAAGQVLREPTRILSLCNNIPSSYINECIYGALNVIIDFWGENLKSQASEYCQKLPQNYKAGCYQTITQRIEGIFKNVNQKRGICETFEKSYQYLCQKEN